MTRLLRAWGRFVAWACAREDPLSLALCRIAAGAGICAHMVRMVTSGAATLVWTTPATGPGFSSSDGWLAYVGGAAPITVVVVALVCAAAALAMTLGVLTRPAIFVTWLTFRALTDLDREAAGAYDTLAIDVLVPLFFSGCGEALSILRRAGPVVDVARWPRALLVLQLALLYGGTALSKASPGWVPGGDASSLWLFLHEPTWTRFAVDALPSWLFPITQVATTLTWLFEITAPVVVLMILAGRLRRARWAWLAFGVVLHAGIELFMEVGPFLPFMLALYACVVAPADWRAVFARVRRRATGT